MSGTDREGQLQESGTLPLIRDLLLQADHRWHWSFRRADCPKCVTAYRADTLLRNAGFGVPDETGYDDEQVLKMRAAWHEVYKNAGPARPPHETGGAMTATEYDSRPDTWRHIEQVRHYLHRVASDLILRAEKHDQSKLIDPERSVFDEFTPKLKTSTYGSAEYEGFRKAMGEGLEHHYKWNDHHPEHFDGGIAEMGLTQITEMLCDWLAAVKRHDDGDIRRSIEINAERFGYGDEIKRLLLNTVEAMGESVTAAAASSTPAPTAAQRPPLHSTRMHQHPRGNQ